MLEDGVIEYERHDTSDRYNKKEVDQPVANKTGTLTENGEHYHKILDLYQRFRQLKTLIMLRKKRYFNLRTKK